MLNIRTWYEHGTNEVRMRYSGFISQLLFPLETKPDFLNPSRNTRITPLTYSDDSHWDKSPTSYKIKKMVVDNTTFPKLTLAPG